MIAKRLYNEARNILIQAGSRTANAAHPVHDDVREYVGRKLLSGAEGEFTAAGGGHMTAAQTDAVQDARQRMGL